MAPNQQGGAAGQALVVGGGIIGLTSALRLQEAGYRVRIWSADPVEHTVSSIAAAIWYPFRAYPADRVKAWGERTFRVFEEHAAHPASGVRLLEGRILWNEPDDPGLEQVPGGSEEMPPSALPPGYGRGATAILPVVETPIYLAWLADRFRAGGGEVEQRRARSLEEALTVAPLVIHCTGLAARELAGDPAVHPIRGQVVRVENPGLDRYTLDAGDHGEEITYVIPRSREVILGGTATPDAWDAEPDSRVAEAILRRCLALEPALEGARVLGHRVGLRPGRPAVRLEREDRPDGRRLVHNYGHGGSGVTVCWGCADQVVALAAGAPPLFTPGGRA